MQREAQVVTQTFEFSGDSAREAAALLGLDKGNVLELELPEHLVNGSGQERNRITWNPAEGKLTFDGRWYDWKTAHPHRKGPRYSFGGPDELDQKALGIFKHWARIHQRIQAHGKSIGKRPEEIRRVLTLRMEPDQLRRASWLSRFFSRLRRRSQTLIFESLTDRHGKGLWLEVRVGPWIK